MQLPNWADGMAVTFEAEAKSKLAPVGRHEGPGQNLNQSPDGHLVTTHLLDNNHREGLDCLTPDGMLLQRIFLGFQPACPSRVHTRLTECEFAFRQHVHREYILTTINGWQKPCQRARFQAR